MRREKQSLCASIEPKFSSWRRQCRCGRLCRLLRRNCRIPMARDTDFPCRPFPRNWWRCFPGTPWRVLSTFPSNMPTSRSSDIGWAPWWRCRAPSTSDRQHVQRCCTRSKNTWKICFSSKLHLNTNDKRMLPLVTIGDPNFKLWTQNRQFIAFDNHSYSKWQPQKPPGSPHFHSHGSSVINRKRPSKFCKIYKTLKWVLNIHSSLSNQDKNLFLVSYDSSIQWHQCITGLFKRKLTFIASNLDIQSQLWEKSEKVFFVALNYHNFHHI